ncbi:amidohydrolase family protein [Arthrobacter dokdonensis]|uniref:amidohydrolase family protein n=1 Tax=Arthrobacter dokdonellae TaxID=2211210 RepID=UPI001D131E83|nr:amidohydrolase family protein [Arthrobacter dokdonellae]
MPDPAAEPRARGAGDGVVRVDAHLHLWELADGRYAWLAPEHGPLYRTFTAEEARETLAAAGVGRAILVQADDTAADTEAMLATAEAHDFIAGVVGWLPLEDPSAFENTLGAMLQNPHFCGVRTLIHDDPRPDVLDRPAVRQSLGLLAAAGLAFDVPDAFPRHLGQAATVARDFPGLTVVLDHLGKPPRAGSDADMVEWERQLRALATLPNTVAKVSGLHCAGTEFSAAALERVWTAALEAFGPDRLMFGGDWPVSLLGASYADTVGTMSALTATLSASERGQVWAGTAQRVYTR